MDLPPQRTYMNCGDIVAEAVRNNRLDILNTLRPRPCDVREWWYVGLRIAAIKGFVGVFDWFDKYGAATPDHCQESRVALLAAECGHLNVLEWLEKHGAVTPEFCREHSLLMAAAEKGHVRVLIWLRKLGAATLADCRAKNCSALLFAAMNKHMLVLQWLHHRLPIERKAEA